MRDHHVERAYRSTEKLTKSKKKSIQIVGGGDFNSELEPGLVSDVSVLDRTHLKRDTREETG